MKEFHNQFLQLAERHISMDHTRSTRCQLVRLVVNLERHPTRKLGRREQVGGGGGWEEAGEGVDLKIISG